MVQERSRTADDQLSGLRSTNGPPRKENAARGSGGMKTLCNLLGR
jgi:hypothetical protein